MPPYGCVGLALFIQGCCGGIGGGCCKIPDIEVPPAVNDWSIRWICSGVRDATSAASAAELTAGGGGGSGAWESGGRPIGILGIADIGGGGGVGCSMWLGGLKVLN